MANPHRMPPGRPVAKLREKQSTPPATRRRRDLRLLGYPLQRLIRQIPIVFLNRLQQRNQIPRPRPNPRNRLIHKRQIDFVRNSYHRKGCKLSHPRSPVNPTQPPHP